MSLCEGPYFLKVKLSNMQPIIQEKLKKQNEAGLKPDLIFKKVEFIVNGKA